MTQQELHAHPLYLSGIPEEQIELWDGRWENISAVMPKLTRDGYYRSIIQWAIGEAKMKLKPDPTYDALHQDLKGKDWSRCSTWRVGRMGDYQLPVMVHKDGEVQYFPVLRDVLDVLSTDGPHKKVVIRKGQSVGMSSGIIEPMLRYYSSYRPGYNCTDAFLKNCK